MMSHVHYVPHYDQSTPVAAGKGNKVSSEMMRYKGITLKIDYNAASGRCVVNIN